MITKGKEAKEGILNGINETADIVKTTLGAKGKTVAIKDKYGLGFDVTKDGVKVALSVELQDSLESIGSDFVKNAARKTVEEAEDGTTTTSILTQSMCNNIYKSIELGENPNQLIKDLNKDLENVVKYIESKSTKVTNTDEIENIATISANNDPHIGKIIKDIYDNSGFNVEINVVESDNNETTFDLVNGFTMRDTGYSSNQFINNYEKGRVEFENPRIYLMNGKVKFTSQNMIDIMGNNSDRNSEDFRPTVIIVEDIEEAPLREIVMAYSNDLIHSVCIVQSNLIFEDRKNSFIDASIFLDAEYSEDSFLKYGTCEKIIIDKDNVTFINGAGNVSKHLERLKKTKNKNISITNRIFSLESTAAIINVGGKISSEISEKKDRIDDAVGAVKSSLEEGYTPGGSSVFLFAGIDVEIKTDIMKKALTSCYEQLLSNANLQPFYYYREILDKGFGFGFNLITEEVVNMIDNGILDSSKVLRVSLENAVRTACNFALVESVIH